MIHDYSHLGPLKELRFQGSCRFCGVALMGFGGGKREVCGNPDCSDRLEEERSMAKKPNTNGETQDSSHRANYDVQHRAAVIAKGFEEWARLNDEIRIVTDKYVKPLTKARTKLIRSLKKDLDIPRYVLKAQFDLFEIARDAKVNDEDGGELVMEHLRECHLALHPGETLDWTRALMTANEAHSASA